MKKDNKLVVVTVLIAVLFAAVAVSQATVPSTKAAVGGQDVEISYNPQEVTAMADTVLAEVELKTTKKKDLVVFVTAECALMTDTTVKGQKVSDTDLASIDVWVEITPNDSPLDEGKYEGLMGPVTFAERVQTMKGSLSDMTYVCVPTDLNGDGTIDEGEEVCDWQDIPEEVRLILNTTSANAFNFYILDLEPGVHTITVYADVTSQENGVDSSQVLGAVGARSVIVQELRLLND